MELWHDAKEWKLADKEATHKHEVETMEAVHRYEVERMHLSGAKEQASLELKIKLAQLDAGAQRLSVEAV
jgi:hypothetical protein